MTSSVSEERRELFLSLRTEYQVLLGKWRTVQTARFVLFVIVVSLITALVASYWRVVAAPLQPNIPGYAGASRQFAHFIALFGISASFIIIVAEAYLSWVSQTYLYRGAESSKSWASSKVYVEE